MDDIVTQRIKIAMKELSVTPKILSDSSGIAYYTVTDILRGRLKSVHKLSDAMVRHFGVSKRWLESGEGKMLSSDTPNHDFGVGAKPTNSASEPLPDYKVTQVIEPTETAIELAAAHREIALMRELLTQKDRHIQTQELLIQVLQQQLESCRPPTKTQA